MKKGQVSESWPKIGQSGHLGRHCKAAVCPANITTVCDVREFSSFQACLVAEGIDRYIHGQFKSLTLHRDESYFATTHSTYHLRTVVQKF